MILSDAYSSQNRGLAASYMLGCAGWAIGAAATICYVRRRFSANNTIIALSVAGWGVGAFMGAVLWQFWAQMAETWQLGFLGPSVAPFIGGVIGGALTLPMQSLSPPFSVLRRVLWGAIIWGVSFLVFQYLAFIAGYILMLLTVNQLAPLVGDRWAQVPGWVLPAGLGGFLAGRLASRLTLFKKDDQPS